MRSLLILLRPSTNRVYSDAAAELAAAELEIISGAEVGHRRLAGVDYLELATPEGTFDPDAVDRLSARYAAYEEVDGLLRPVPVPGSDRFGDDLVQIPKYPGKTNEQFTRLLVNVTLGSRVARPTGSGPLSILDPMCGRGTTLSTAITLGAHGYGVEADVGAVEAYTAFLRTYLRRKRLKHSIELNPLRREGRTLGKRLVAEIAPDLDTAPAVAVGADAGGRLKIEVLTGDTRASAALWGRKRFDAVITDAPYGVVHRSQTDQHPTRSATALLTEAVPVWAEQLKHGGVLGLAWNTYTISRERLTELAVAAGLEPMAGGPYERLGHRVDAAIQRDVFVARKPLVAEVGHRAGAGPGG